MLHAIISIHNIILVAMPYLTLFNVIALSIQCGNDF